MQARWLVAGVVALGAWGWAGRAKACSCGELAPRTLLPSVTSLAPATGPWLVLHDGDGVATLRTEGGEPVALAAPHSFSALALCPRQFDLLRPAAPLEVGARYQLSIQAGGPADSRNFRATDREPATLPVTAHVKLVHTVVDTQSGGCYPTKLDGLHAKGLFDVSVELDRPALLLVELSASDSKFERLADGTATLSEGMASEIAVSTTATATLEQLDTTADCVTLKIFDSRDTPLFDQELCPKPGQTLESDHAFTVSEHYVPEPGEEPESSCGCRLGSSQRRLPGALALLVLAFIGGVGRGRPRTSRR